MTVKFTRPVVWTGEPVAGPQRPPSGAKRQPPPAEILTQLQEDIGHADALENPHSICVRCWCRRADHVPDPVTNRFACPRPADSLAVQAEHWRTWVLAGTPLPYTSEEIERMKQPETPLVVPPLRLLVKDLVDSGPAACLCPVCQAPARRWKPVLRTTSAKGLFFYIDACELHAREVRAAEEKRLRQDDQ